MKLFAQLSVLLTFCTYHYEALSTALCASNFLCLSLWSSFHISLCYWHSVSVTMKLLPQLFVLLTFCTCNYEAPSTDLVATNTTNLTAYRQSTQQATSSLSASETTVRSAPSSPSGTVMYSRRSALSDMGQISCEVSVSCNIKNLLLYTVPNSTSIHSNLKGGKKWSNILLIYHNFCHQESEAELGKT